MKKKRIKLKPPKETKEEKLRREINELDMEKYRQRNYNYIVGRYKPKIKEEDE